MDWREFENEVGELATTIDFKPDIIIGIARGGIIPAVLLAKILKVKEMLFLRLVREGVYREIKKDIAEDLTGKSIVLVEDMIETGQGFILGKEYLESKGATVKMACLYTMPHPEIRPDYFLREVKEVVAFPWNQVHTEGV